MKQPVVSIVIPCYNDGQYLQQAVDSCLRQTYRHIEVIVVDDGSNDRVTQKELETLSNRGIIVLRTEQKGPAGARNKAVGQAQGKYILPLDADDWIEPEYIACAVDILETNQDIGIVYCCADLFGEQEGIWQLPEYSLETFLLDNCIFITSMFRKTDWETVGGFSEKFEHGLEDYDFWMSLIELGRKVYQFPDVWFHYRIKKSSRTVRMISNIDCMVETYALLYQRHRRLYMQHNDAYLQGLRRALIEQKMLCGSNAAQKKDAVAEYWQSIKLLKPQLARRIEKLVEQKNRLQQRLKNRKGKYGRKKHEKGKE